ncbi:MAG: class I SAM-dependent methyltransferase [bacterium]|nr:class I SAM-dependent methyltransferase [bacterium]
MLKRLLYVKRMLTVRPKKYRNLLKTIYKKRCQSIMEIGTHNGIHSRHMIETANIFQPMNRITYYGFDLFEGLTDEDFQKELAKKPPTYDEIRQRLEKTGANINLYMGYTKDTLPKFLEESKDEQIDFIFIDGGHSIETISLDWSYVKKIMYPNTVVIFDDYYSNKEAKDSGFGCQSLINNLDRDVYDIEILEPMDHFGGDTPRDCNMVKVEVKKT